MLHPGLDLLPHRAYAKMVWIGERGLLMDFPRVGTEGVRYFAEAGGFHDELGKEGEKEIFVTCLNKSGGSKTHWSA